MDKDYLVLKRASASRPSGEWNDDDFDVQNRRIRHQPPDNFYSRQTG
jgi:hypothetical protein